MKRYPPHALARPALALVIALALLILMIRTARAGTIRYAKPASTGDATCLSWPNACTLSMALSISNPGDEIRVKQGTHKPTTGTDRSATFQLRSGVAVYGGYSGNVLNPTERDPVAYPTILSGDIGSPGLRLDNSYHVVKGSWTDSLSVLDGVTISDGNADNTNWWLDVFGGGMLNDMGSPTVRNVTFANNWASSSGGGLYTDLGMQLTNVTFVNNWSQLGGGMFIDAEISTLTNVTFNGNQASTNGGGLCNNYSGSTLKNVTFSGNLALGSGGGMYDTGWSLVVRNALFWNNSATTGAQIYNTGNNPPVASRLYDSIVQGGCPTGNICDNVTTADPLLGAFDLWGGSTKTFPLLPGSSAIDAGDDATCAVTDQRGVWRDGQGAHCDIGAYESQGFTLAKTGGDNQSAVITTAFGTPLGISVSSSHGEPVNGGIITFAAPSSGASTTSSPVATVTIAGGAVSQTVAANGLAGAYAVTANASGVTAPAVFSLTNAKADTATVISASANPSVVNQSVTLTVKVSASAPGSGTPTGSVVLYDTLPLSAPVRAPRVFSAPLTGGVATFALSSLSVGTHNLSAAYSGDANFNSSISPAYAHVVQVLKLFLPALLKTP